MKMRAAWGVVCLALLTALGACSNSSEADKVPPMEIEGVKVDAPRLVTLFMDASPELYSKVNEAVTNLRYKLYLEAMMGLDDVLEKNPGLTDKQKQLLRQVIAQLKEVNAKAPRQPNQ